MSAEARKAGEMDMRAQRQFSDADCEAAARKLLPGLFSRCAQTTDEEALWQRDIDLAVKSAKSESDPRMKKAMLQHLKVCQYSLDRAKSVNASLLAHKDESERSRREWEQTEERAAELLATRRPAPPTATG